MEPSIQLLPIIPYSPYTDSLALQPAWVFRKMANNDAGQAACEQYAKGTVLPLTIGTGPASRNVDAKIIRAHVPFTMSCVLTVELPGTAIGDSNQPTQAILKLYDRRFAAQLRKDEGGDECWSPEIENEFAKFVASGEAAQFVSKLRDDDDFEEPEEGLGKQVPCLYATVSIYLASDAPARPGLDSSTEFGVVKGLLLEYVPGPTLTEMPDVIPKESWQGIVDQAVGVVRAYSHLGILNKDVRCSNFVINESVPDGDERRVMMVDFGLCEFRPEGMKDEEWGRKKCTKDEEGAVGAVMKTRLAKKSFELRYESSSTWSAFAETEEEYNKGREELKRQGKLLVVTREEWRRMNKEGTRRDDVAYEVHISLMSRGKSAADSLLD
ncbi:unnamed protein product [Zymoseptoria tritici ST99CH_3D7]|uniref:Protein kinase domain-containing protein n=2 Tax=Zymoseptoria tritici TaxID=1047171 RepID=A0A1X7RJU8_ZYMT9|nr:unnamed protein product [Zymoseptoria tritici ST99CH_3D7]